MEKNPYKWNPKAYDNGDANAVVETDEFVDDGTVLSEFSLLLYVVIVLFASGSVRSGNDECWTRLICEERLLWYKVSSSLSTSISLKTKTDRPHQWC